MDSMKVTLTGTVPFKIQNIRMANPLDPFSKAIKKISSKKKKTDDDYAEMARLGFLGGLYCDDKIGPYVPGNNFGAMLFDAAKIQKKAKCVKSSLQIIEDLVPLEYEGPRTPEKLWASGKFHETKPVRTTRGPAPLRTVAMFFPWAVSFEIAVDSSVLDLDEVRGFLDLATVRIGCGVDRPRFGKFSWEEVAA